LLTSVDCVADRPTWRVRHERVTLSLGALKAGDIILTRPLHQSVGSRAVAACQRGLGCGTHASSWTHVAIFDGLSAWEAMPGTGVAARSIHHIVDRDVRVLVRRLAGHDFDQGRLMKVLVAQESVDYSVLPYLPSLLQRRLGLKPAAAAPSQLPQLICSVFVDRVLKMTANRTLFPSVQVTVPADFQSSDQFVDVPLAWTICSSR